MRWGRTLVLLPKSMRRSKNWIVRIISWKTLTTAVVHFAVGGCVAATDRGRYLQILGQGSRSVRIFPIILIPKFQRYRLSNFFAKSLFPGCRLITTDIEASKLMISHFSYHQICGPLCWRAFGLRWPRFGGPFCRSFWTRSTASSPCPLCSRWGHAGKFEVGTLKKT